MLRFLEKSSGCYLVQTGPWPGETVHVGHRAKAHVCYACGQASVFPEGIDMLQNKKCDGSMIGRNRFQKYGCPNIQTANMFNHNRLRIRRGLNERSAGHC